MRITDVPDDVLEHIFLTVRDMCLSEAGGQPDARAPSQAVPTHDGRPTLWTVIRVTGTFSNRTLVNQMLARAGDRTLLSVVFTRHRAAPTAAAAFDFLAAASDLAQHHAHRVRELGALALPSPDWVRSVAEGFAGCDVPRLERLRVASSYEGEMGPRIFAGTRRSVSLRIVRAGSRTWLEADEGFG